MACPGENWIVPGANPCANAGNSIAGVTSLNGEIGSLDIVAGDSSMIVTSGAGQVTLKANIGGNVVNTLNYMIGDLVIQSANNSITVVEDILTKKIDLTANFPSTVTTFNTINGPVTLAPADGSITVTNNVPGKTVALKANFPAILSTVTSVNTIKGDMTLTSTDGSLTLTGNTLTKNINFKANFPTPPVIPSTLTSLNTLKGIATLTSLNSTVNISTNTITNSIDLSIPPLDVGVTGITIATGVPVVTGLVEFQGLGATTVGYFGPNIIRVETLAVEALNPGNVTGTVNLISSDSTVIIENSGDNIDFKVPGYVESAFTSWGGMGGQINSFGSPATIPAGGTCYLLANTTGLFYTYLNEKTYMVTSVNIPYTCANFLTANTLQYGFVNGLPSALPGFPIDAQKNNGMSPNSYTGIISQVFTNALDIRNPAAGTVMYLAVRNVSAYTIVLNEIPAVIIYNFI